MKLEYMSGFQNMLSTEALKNSLPQNQNSPQQTPFGLYPEQFSTTAFTAPQKSNLRSWLYRLRPSVGHGEFKPYKHPTFFSHTVDEAYTPNPLRWDPPAVPSKSQDFISGLVTYTVAGSPAGQSGCAVHMYTCNVSMENTFFQNSDAEMLIIPQEGQLCFKTEFGILEIKPLEILVIPRGVKFQVLVQSDKARGYVLENFGSYLRLPDLGPIGANGLANPRHFLAPVANYVEETGNFKLLNKFMGELFVSNLKHNPLDVVAWYGNTYPYKYDLTLFNTINTVSFDHPDPSIFTVLTSPSHEVGTANVDFVIFPPRWMVAENTFRPPYFHRNCMSEFMGLIVGTYDAKQEGFLPGGASLHNTMTPHGPDLETYQKATHDNLKPAKMDQTMAFMLETRYTFRTTEQALKSKYLQKDYLKCWSGFEPEAKTSIPKNSDNKQKVKPKKP